MTFFSETKGDYTISDQPELLQVDIIHDFLTHHSYWAQGRSKETVIRSLENSLCLGVYYKGQQVGLARIITDRATFAWLCDVFIVETQRGKDLGKWLVSCVIRHPDLQGLRRILLATRDAHDLYNQHGGFQPLQSPDRYMERFNPNPAR